MTVTLYIILLTMAGMWNILDGWVSLSLYLKDERQCWLKDHYIRVIRIVIGVLLIWLAYLFGMAISR